MTLHTLASLGGAGFSYNSYIPYLTFPVLSSLYLMNANVKRAIRLISFGVFIILSVYILLSTSRQSILFITFCGGIFFINSKKVIFVTALLLITLMTFLLLTSDGMHRNLRDKYTAVSSASHTLRLKIAIHGLSLLQPEEFITGAGLSSVINSGPHNDYIRWLQKVGLLTMFIGFYPFFLAAWRLYPTKFCHKNKALYLYLFLSIMFTLYHSLFGYPREDAYQAVYCFLGLAMGLGIRAENILILVTKSENNKLLSRFIYTAGNRVITP
jgi:hypothetical protein